MTSNILDYYKPRIKKAVFGTLYNASPEYKTRLLQEAGNTKELDIPIESGKSVYYSPAQVAGYFYGKDLPEVYQKARENLRKYKTPQEVGFTEWNFRDFINPLEIRSVPNIGGMPQFGIPRVLGAYAPVDIWSARFNPYINLYDATAKGKFTPDTILNRFPGILSHETIHGYTWNDLYQTFKNFKSPEDLHLRYMFTPNETDARLANLKRYAYQFGIHLDTPEKTKDFINALDIWEKRRLGKQVSKADFELANKLLRNLSGGGENWKKLQEYYFYAPPKNIREVLEIRNYIENNIPEPQRSKLLRAIYERATQLVKNNNQQRVVG